MEIIITGRHVDITPAIREYGSAKAAKLPRYFDRVQRIEVVASKHDPRQYEVEIVVDAEHHHPFVGKAMGTDLYACIDDVVDKVERQLTDHKQKLRNRKHNV